jgi:hypothetical protein
MVVLATGAFSISLQAAVVTPGGSQTNTTGGPFNVFVNAGPVGMYATGSNFNTFCVEQGEHFGPGNSYYVVVSDRARFGTNGTDGTDAYGSYDLLNPETAYLYSNYMGGTMTTVIGTWTGSNTDLIALQDAIWSLEGESVGLTSLANSIKTQALAAVSGSWGNTIGNVRVMQLWTSAATVNTQGGKVQDMLVLVPTPVASLAGSSLLAGMAVCGIIRRRRALQG